MNSYYTNSRPEVIALIPPSTKRLLDVGCGAGMLGRAAKLSGVKEVYGIELSTDPAHEAMRCLDGVVQGSIEHDHLPWTDFDCIVCADVLEHLVDPWKVLTKLRDHLVPGGVIVASIPNVANISVLKLMLRDRFEYAEGGILDRAHLRFFTKHTIWKMFAECGYTILTHATKSICSRRLRALQIMSFGLLNHLSVVQYLVVASPNTAVLPRA